ncbi:MAG TPA: hypothetical protein VG498_22975 [Terriglobales bacterium]|nr:hypothetical protein [Terriglobales bacterium]
MSNRLKPVATAATYLLIILPALAQDRLTANGAPAAVAPHSLIWTDPGDISSKNLFYGSGGKENLPRPPLTFEKEDIKGSNPKFDARDQNGTKWKVKLGVEARPETVAARLLWAVGYLTEDEYLISRVKVEDLPAHWRGTKFVKAGGELADARLKHHPAHADKDEQWHWRKNPFTGTREFNGLRVMMSLINNWDLKDENTAIYEEKNTGARMYLVADLGASFGSIGYRLGPGRGKGNLNAYKNSKFVTHVDKDYVNFSSPAHSTVIGILGIFSMPNFVTRMRLRWIGRHIPRDDAKWIGSLLAQLKSTQIDDAFRAAGYSDAEIQTYASVVKKRIAELGDL